MNKRTLTSFFVSLLALGAPRLASAQLAVTSARCTSDWLMNAADAINRRAWAQRWYDANPYNYTTGSWKDPRFYNSVKFKSIIDSYLDRAHPIQLYPVYSNPQNQTKWRPPYKLNYDASYQVKPAQVINDAVCQAGCYTPEQEVLFDSGPLPILHAQESALGAVLTLTPSSTFDALSFMVNQVEEYVVDDEAAEQDILIFHTQSGGELKVTLEHPLVAEDGSIRAAEDFVIGDHLVREDGSFDAVQSITPIKWVGRVYNLRPRTTDLVSNILVAQGYLNGSVRYQNEFVEELNRMLLRVNIPDEVTPAP